MMPSGIGEDGVSAHFRAASGLVTAGLAVPLPEPVAGSQYSLTAAAVPG
jgi:hypothetical protein